MSRLDKTIGTSGYDNLINSTDPGVECFHVTLKSGQGVLERGTLLATGSSGLEKISSGTTGKANAILAETIDTAEGTVALAYRTGHFNANALIVANGYTITDADKEALRVAGILLSDAVAL